MVEHASQYASPHQANKTSRQKSNQGIHQLCAKNNHHDLRFANTASANKTHHQSEAMSESITLGHISGIGSANVSTNAGVSVDPTTIAGNGTPPGAGAIGSSPPDAA